ncbi:hypothetical protein QCA50_018097 [Cerrena zonata]|uniref:Uncharacterized protein n=1 Tax=Cerrena zonata TaxID=2478898 RepID=A0AAW0FNU2_9APHY
MAGTPRLVIGISLSSHQPLTVDSRHLLSMIPSLPPPPPGRALYCYWHLTPTLIRLLFDRSPTSVSQVGSSDFGYLPTPSFSQCPEASPMPSKPPIRTCPSLTPSYQLGWSFILLLMSAYVSNGGSTTTAATPTLILFSSTRLHTYLAPLEVKTCIAVSIWSH